MFQLVNWHFTSLSCYRPGTGQRTRNIFSSPRTRNNIFCPRTRNMTSRTNFEKSLKGLDIGLDRFFKYSIYNKSSYLKTRPSPLSRALRPLFTFMMVNTKFLKSQFVSKIYWSFMYFLQKSKI
jgi:hypothetical protein